MKNIDFYKRIAVVGADIPAGKVVTYGQLALLCGKPNNARQVGYALNRGRVGREFPAYKVVNGQGYLSGAASFATPDMQKKLLESEGIEVKENNRVNLTSSRKSPTSMPTRHKWWVRGTCLCQVGCKPHLTSREAAMRLRGSSEADSEYH